jgi:protein SCO1/2
MHSDWTHQDGRAPVLWIAGALALAAGVYLASLARQPAPPQLSQATTHLPAPKALQAFELLTHNGEPFTLDSLKGHWSFVFFGYTHCPDVCPTTLATLSAVAKQLVQAGRQPPAAHFYFVSVDPERDTQAHLAQFVPYFNSEFVGVTGEPAQIDNLTRQLSILYVKGAPDAQGGYLVDHTASVLLLNPSGQFEAVFSPPLNATNIVADFEKLARYHAETQ